MEVHLGRTHTADIQRGDRPKLVDLGLSSSVTITWHGRGDLEVLAATSRARAGEALVESHSLYIGASRGV
ncbi:hypothetical protein GS467_24215 [Rhodococcus hoagii]|nr:hypothetical protein [Prescottella equi]